MHSTTLADPQTRAQVRESIQSLPSTRDQSTPVLRVAIAIAVIAAGAEQLLYRGAGHYLTLLYLVTAAAFVVEAWGRRSERRTLIEQLGTVGWLAVVFATIASNRQLPYQQVLGSSVRLILLASVLLYVARRCRTQHLAPMSSRSLRLAMALALGGLAIAVATGYQPRPFTTAHLVENYSTAAGGLRSPGFLATPSELGLVLAFCAIGLIANWRRRAGAIDLLLGLAGAAATFYTGSRTAVVILGFGLGCVFLLPMSFDRSRMAGRRPRVGALLAVAIVIAALAAPGWGTLFSGRSLLPTHATDGSAIYRRATLRFLDTHVAADRPLGSGFHDGNQLAVTPITRVVPNVDDNYYYLYLGVGLIGGIGIGVLLLSVIGAGLRSGFALTVALTGGYLIAGVTESLAASAPISFAVLLATAALRDDATD